MADLRLLIFITLLVSVSQCVAQPFNSGFVDVSDTLFPDSTKWLQLDKTPTLSPSQFKTIKSALEQAYRNSLSLSSNHLEGQNCSFIKRALTTTNSTSFHQFDANLDGFPDIVYSGHAHCSEGDSTVIWFGAPGKYVVPPEFPWMYLLLRISPEKGSITAVAQGCCGNPKDEYFLGTLKNPRVDSMLQVVNKTILPPSKVDRRQHFIAKNEVKLRITPRLLDSYDQAKSYFLGNAAFGNIIRVYLPESKGIILGKTTENKHAWVFVVMDAESDALVSHDPYRDVRAGWLLDDGALLFKK